MYRKQAKGRLRTSRPSIFIGTLQAMHQGTRPAIVTTLRDMSPMYQDMLEGANQ